MSFANGQWPASALDAIPGGHLEKQAAAAFNAMNEESVRRFGVHLVVRDSYRPLGRPGDLDRGVWSQWAAWERFQRGGNLAARPGTSNHGNARAVDLATQEQRAVIDRIGARYGFTKGCSDAAKEWWHIIYNPSCTGATWTPVDPFRHLHDDEHRWVRELLDLRQQGYKHWSAKDKRRAAALRRVLRKRADTLDKAGHPKKWHRGERITLIRRVLAHKGA